MSSPEDVPAQLPPRAQSLLAAAVAASLAMLATWYLAAGGPRGGLVHHDAPPAATGRFTLDVNTAAVEELAQLPGVGPATARAIVEHRRRHGRFRDIDDLLDVPGIGAATLAGMRPHLRPIRGGGAAP